MSTEAAALREGALVARTKIHVEPHDTASGRGAGYYAPGDRLPDDLNPASVREFLEWGSAARGVPYVNDGPTIPASEIGRIASIFGCKVNVRVEKYEDKLEAGDSELRAADPAERPDDVVETEDNLLTIGGASALWHRLIGGTDVDEFSEENAHLGVGDSNTAAADSQTDLQASENKAYKQVDEGYPQHTDSASTSGAKTITFRATFGTSEANFAWNEWAVFNASTSGRMLNRKVESLGEKTSSATWTLTITLTLA